MARDNWLYQGTKSGRRTQELVTKAKGRIDPASDMAYGMLEFDPRAPRIVEWGGRPDPTGRVTAVSKAAPQWPDSRQLRDPFTTFYVQGIALEPPLPPDRLLNLTEENPLHSACLMAKSIDACGRGWSFEPKEGKEGDESLIHSEVPTALKQQMEDITPDLTFGEMLYQAAWEMDAIGWSVWEVVRTIGGKKHAPGSFAPIGAIYPIPAHTIRASLDPRKWVQIRAGRVRYFKKFGALCDIDNETGTLYDWKRKADVAKVGDMDPEYVASEIIIFKTYTPRSLWYGLPKWVSAVATVAEMGAIREFNISWFASGGQTDYHMHFAAASLEIATDMVKQAKEQMAENAGRGHTNLLTAGTEDTKVTVSKLGELLREGHFRFRRQDLAKEILIAHSVPPYRIGWSVEGSLGGNAAPEMLAAYKFGAVEPIQNIVEDRLRATLFNPDLGGIKTGEFRLKLVDLDLTDLQRELEAANKNVETGIITPNQAREKIGDEPDKEHPELDEYYYHGTKVGAAPEPSPFAPGGQPGELKPGEVDYGVPIPEDQKHVDKVLDVIATLEATLKEALEERDPIEPGRVDGRKPMGRGKGKPIAVVSPSRDDVPASNL